MLFGFIFYFTFQKARQTIHEVQKTERRSHL